MKIKFICLNLWFGGKLFEPIIEFLQREKPDILAVQEVYDSKDKKIEDRFRSVEEIKKRLGFKYDFFSPACVAVFPDKKIPAGNAIFSHFPISKSNTIFIHSSFGEVENYEAPIAIDFSFTPRNMQHAEIKINNNKLNVFNTQGVWGKDSADNEDRLKMSEAIVQNIKDKENVILCGDFNITPETQTIGNIEKYLKNIFKGEIKTSFNVKQKTNPIFSSLVVDMIFASHNLKIVNYYCPKVDVSDHLPLAAIFEA
jgi:endonuclease/exonuclease/phosphatase family metal-dependent hydrolase